MARAISSLAVLVAVIRVFADCNGPVLHRPEAEGRRVMTAHDFVWFRADARDDNADFGVVFIFGTLKREDEYVYPARRWHIRMMVQELDEGAQSVD
jgi:hypothetical protein